ncbi:MAG: hypothetical protein QOK43_509 [Acidimicrobiaceae bacterium]|nr:hypothetical protein [Acidimicrobiaceae bacterium]
MRRLLFALAASVPVVAALAPTSAQAAGPPTLGQQVLDAIGGSGAAARSAVVDMDGLGRIASLNATGLLPPASTEKLYTGGAALLRLGPTTRLRTLVRRTGPINGATGVLEGSLVLVARGDPNLTGAGLDDLAAQAAAAGVRRVAGNIIVNDAHFDRARSAPGWKAGWVPGESGPLSAFALDGNRWSTAAGFLANPNLANGDRFREALSRAGISVDGRTRVSATRWDDPVVAAHDSATVAEIVRNTLKNSDNFAAELLLKEVGVRAAKPTTAGGVSAVRRLAIRMGVPIGGRMVDGSGLSSLDQSRAADQVAWLEAMARSNIAGPFRDALPVACVDGTLDTRMCGTAAAGRVQAKTGTLPGVVTLSGYTTTLTGRQVTFSFLLAGAGDTNKARTAIDKAVVALASYRG